MQIIFLTLLTIGFCQAQSVHSDITTYVDKLQLVKEIQDPVDRDTQLIWQYNYISEELARNLDPRTEAYLDTLRLMSELTPWDNARGFYYRAMGRYSDFQGNFSEALSFYDMAINAFKPAGGDLKELAFTYVLKGFLLSNSEMYQECIKTLKEGIPYASETNYKNSLCLMLDWFGDYYYYGLEDSINNEIALDYYLQVNQILPFITYPRIIADNHAVLSGVYARLGRKAEAAYHFPIADSLCKAENLPYVRWGLYAEKARSLENENKHSEANEIYLIAKNFMEATTSIEFKARLEKALSNNYKNLGNYKLALSHYENMVAMEEVMAIDEVKKKYADIEAKYNLSVKEKEIADLQRSKIISNRNLALSILAISLIASTIIIRKNKILKRNYLLLEQQQKEVEKAIYTGETQERKRLSAELHDQVNTKLAAAKWQLEAISEKLYGVDREIIDNTTVMLNDAYQDVRNISHNLVPTRLETEGLIKSVEDLFIKLNKNAAIKFKLYAESIEEQKIERITYPLYSIIFELINNILKHAQASQVTIRITESAGNLDLIINDDGQGFDVQNIQPGFGLSSITNRVKSLKGTIDITSSNETGTQTYIRIPLL